MYFIVKVTSGPFFYLNIYNKIKVHKGKVGSILKELIDKIIENLSTKDVFLFRVTCASCGTDYGNRAIRFTKAGVVPATQSKRIIYDALYEQELKAARQVAVRSAAEHMNYCPICKRLVCNQCFLICDDLDMCHDCAVALEEKGKPVLSTIADVGS